MKSILEAKISLLSHLGFQGHSGAMFTTHTVGLHAFIKDDASLFTLWEIDGRPPLCSSSHCSLKQKCPLDDLGFELYLVDCITLSALETKNQLCQDV